MKAKGERDVFALIYAHRKPVSYISGKRVDPRDSRCYAHVLGKGAYPKFRLCLDNIVFLTPEEHNLYDQGSDEQRKAYQKRNPTADWEKLYELREELQAAHLIIDKRNQFMHIH